AIARKGLGDELCGARDCRRTLSARIRPRPHVEGVVAEIELIGVFALKAVDEDVAVGGRDLFWGEFEKAVGSRIAHGTDLGGGDLRERRVGGLERDRVLDLVVLAR